jgi:hypothetical protein
MNNQLVIEQIKSGVAQFIEKLTDRETREFKLKDLSITEKGLFLNDMPIDGIALSKVLSILRVKKDFTKFADKMTAEDWLSVSEKIKNAEGNVKLYATISKDPQGNPTVTDAHLHRENKKQSDDASYQQYLDWMYDALSASEIDYSLKSLSFNDQNEMTEIILLNETNEIDVFGTGTDMWKGGERFYFNGLRFNHAPFLQRLSCANGATAAEFGFGADISKTTFNNKRIQSVIKKAIEFGSDNLSEIVQQAAQHLSRNQVSLLEFYQYRDFFEKKNENGKYDKIVDQYFNDQPFYKGYGVNITEKSRKWKSTANTGINAYDFFNLLTYIASHPDEIKVDSEDRIELQIKASSFLFKKELDLEDVAGVAKIDYPKLAIMN